MILHFILRSLRAWWFLIMASDTLRVFWWEEMTTEAGISLTFLVVIPHDAVMSLTASRVSFQLSCRIFPGPCNQISQTAYRNLFLTITSSHVQTAATVMQGRHVRSWGSYSGVPTPTVQFVCYFSAFWYGKLMHSSCELSSFSTNEFNHNHGSKLRNFSIMQTGMQMEDMELGKDP